MEALKLKTIADLLDSPEDRVELIDGEIVQRPMARADHGVAQLNTGIELGPATRRAGPDGWWIATEVSVAYDPHQCPTHDLAGWRKSRMPQRPSGVVELTPDWVCEIVSPGHERKDTLTLFLLLQRQRVPFYWLIWPEDRALIAHRLDGDSYRVVATISLAPEGPTSDEADAETPSDNAPSAPHRARIPPFDDIELDLDYILGT